MGNIIRQVLKRQALRFVRGGGDREHRTFKSYTYNGIFENSITILLGEWLIWCTYVQNVITTANIQRQHCYSKPRNIIPSVAKTAKININVDFVYLEMVNTCRPVCERCLQRKWISGAWCGSYIPVLGKRGMGQADWNLQENEIKFFNEFYRIQVP